MAGISDQRERVGGLAIEKLSEHKTKIEGNTNGKRSPVIRWGVRVRVFVGHYRGSSFNQANE
jgi:hypothetical protein